MSVGDLIKWKEYECAYIEKIGILLDVLDDRGHYSVFKILLPGGGIAVIKFLSELPEIINKCPNVVGEDQNEGWRSS